ncbi:MAG: DNA-directed RNA polymerase subunit L [Theionarchaea archaeon]|nr:DNA-directed RNA polymerase subunit L [Theionarchaea archaeon]MBU6999912.1 DNA-directed RNA polymerase subunit L [Theionarchaea archaeon]MBU7020103.1 DNA-directed RNA polymerase subunit L [Theionarchaea archaeon]MBU7035599.1 DNA-directed RNA polymerase subunit L [Theionarchaea archaeon]MBU7039481.1 DNA-directed RNA polymerase subunit L [Theionarchaea archaeon]
MELEIIAHEKTKLEAALKGEDHTFANLLRETLKEDTHVVSAAYKVGHPLLDKERPVLFLETDGKESPKEALSRAARKIKEQMNEFGARL